jgi:hypothetical protein
MTHKKFVKDVGARGPVSDVLSKLKRGSATGEPGKASCEGWLLKQGAMNTEWKRRWIVLSAAERKLVYSKSDTAKKPQGFIALDNATVEEMPSESGTPSICIKTSAAFDQVRAVGTDFVLFFFTGATSSAIVMRCVQDAVYVSWTAAGSRPKFALNAALSR